MTLLAHAGRPDELVTELLLIGGGFMAWIGVKRLRNRGSLEISRPTAWWLLGGSAVAFASAFVIPATLMNPPTPAAVRPASVSSIAIDEPTPGEHVSGPALGVAIDLIDGKLVPMSTTKLTADTGHLHLYLDGRLVSMGSGALRESVPIDALDPGAHRLRVEFVAADHGPFEPRVQTGVAFVKVP